MLKRLRLKFIIINMSIVTVMLCAILIMVHEFTRLNLERSNLSLLQTAAAENAPPPGKPGELPQQAQLPFFTVELSPKGYRVTGGSESFDLSDAELIQSLVDASLRHGSSTGIIYEYKLRYLRISSPHGEKLVFGDISSDISTLKSLRRNCIMIGLLAFIAFLGISSFLARWAVRPVERAWNQQKQFVADASHELKTPLTVIMANAELLQEEGYDESARRGFTDSVLIMARQMRSLVEQLLALARFDAGMSRAVHESLDLSALCAETVLPFEALFFERGLSLETHIEEGIRVKGSREQLRQVGEILLDNACKYSSAPGTVKLSLRAQGRLASLCVSSPGEEISPEDLKNIFKRFYRLDAARSRTGSFGLGLSIAGNIVQQHQGRIWAESRDGKNRFFVQLPMLS